MKIVRYRDLSDFAKVGQDAWDMLAAGNPMLSSNWICPWWDTYGISPDTELCWLAGFSGDEVVGIAPFYLDYRSYKQGQLRILGDGKVCSDHMGLAAQSDHQALFATTVVDWLVGEAGKSWETAYWDCLPKEDRRCVSVADLLNEAGLSVHQRPACSSWQVNLPNTWDEYLKQLSKSQRKRCRRRLRDWVDSGKLTHATVTDPQELDHNFNELCRLHNSRRNDIGETGAFEDPLFKEFHSRATRKLLEAGQLRLRFLYEDQKPIACEYLFANEQTVFSYQSGFDSAYKSIGAGNISLLLSIKLAIEDGYKVFDFLRGGEQYKQVWAATETPTVDVHVHQKTMRGSLEYAKLGTKDMLRSLKSMVVGQ